MKLFNWFKDKQKQDTEEEKTVDKIELLPNILHTVSKEQFVEEINKYFDLKQYGIGVSDNEKTQIFVGDLDNSIEINSSQNLLVIGNIKSEWVNLTSKEYSESEGSLYVTQNVDCNDFGKFLLINGSLLVKEIINTEFENSCLIVNADLCAKYFHRIDIWADVKGNIRMNYGWGYCKNNKGESITPKNDITTSLNFLGVDEGCDSFAINEIIVGRVSKI
ncbi:hypothetical protein WAF17_17350 [Bernardetia sp. ABR2-2B]|uniref:hypothetical protein n=1 Tax=Bernardetia sp. ABR2-2B TaxID=3127472 RepID=UPI0030CA8259